jgi:hypothetical protein
MKKAYSEEFKAARSPRNTTGMLQGVGPVCPWPVCTTQTPAGSIWLIR